MAHVTKWVVIACVAVVLGYFLATRPGDAATRPKRARVEESESSSRRDATRTMQAQPIAYRPALPAPAPRAAASADEPAPGAGDVRENGFGDSGSPSDEERLVHSASVFDGQTTDVAWALETRRALSSSLDALNDGTSRIKNVECRSTLCRVELEHDSEREEQRFIQQIIRKNAFPGQGMAVRSEPVVDGQARATLYFAREGTPLPEPPVD